MSWSVSFIGKPKNVVTALHEESNKHNGQSKVEYDSALPYLIAIVEQNFALEGSGYNEPIVSLDASGSGTATGGREQVHRILSVTLRPFYTQLV